MLLRGAVLADGTPAGVRVEDGRIAAVGALDARPGEEVEDLDGYTLLPGLVEPHTHLDKAFLYSPDCLGDGDLRSAIAATNRVFPTLDVAEIAGRARRALLLFLQHGVTALRTHVVCGAGLELRALEAMTELRSEFASVVDLQLVAHVAPPSADLRDGAYRQLIRRALAAGADVVGGTPHTDRDPVMSTAISVEEAVAAGVPIDLHTDETLNPAALHVRDFARMVGAQGLGARAVASHCVSLSVQPAPLVEEVAAEMAAAGLAVISLPQTNLYLQGRDHWPSAPRGLAPLGLLRRAGVAVAAGADNIRDPFNPMGQADPLETASLLVAAGHLTPRDALGAITTVARQAMGLPRVEVEPGCVADLVAVAGGSAADVIAGGSEKRLVWKAGRQVCRTSVETTWQGVEQ